MQPEPTHLELIEIRPGRKVAIYYEEHEDKNAPLIYFVHGAGARSGQFRDLQPVFRPSCSLLSFDWTGHGKSEKILGGAEYYAASEMLEDVIAVFQKYNNTDRKVILIAHSYGTSLSVQALPSLDKNICAIILIGTCLHVPASAHHPIWYLPDWCLERVRPWMRNPFVTKAYHPKTIAEKSDLIDYEASFSDQNPMHVMKHLAWGMRWPTLEQFQAVDRPCLLVGGESDKLTPVSELKAVQETIPNSQLEIMAESGHFPMLENSEETIPVIKRFLAEQGIVL